MCLDPMDDLQSYLISSEDIKTQFSTFKTGLCQINSCQMTNPSKATQIVDPLEAEVLKSRIAVISNALQKTNELDTILQKCTKKEMEARAASNEKIMKIIRVKEMSGPRKTAEKGNKDSTTLKASKKMAEPHNALMKCLSETSINKTEYDKGLDDSFKTNLNTGNDSATDALFSCLNQVQPTKKRSHTLRNIELVTDGCGVGMLAITKHEKDKLDELLKDIDQTSGHNDKQIVQPGPSNQETIVQHCGYSISPVSIEMINIIDRKLEELRLENTLSTDSSNHSLIKGKSASSFNVNRRLEEINRTLAALSTDADA